MSSVARLARRVLVLILGGALLIGGAALLVLPGPGLVVIFGGLALLATEFTWAERLLNWAKTRGLAIYRQVRYRVRRWRGGGHSDPALAPTPDQVVVENRPYPGRIAVGGPPNGWHVGSVPPAAERLQVAESRPERHAEEVQPQPLPDAG